MRAVEVVPFLDEHDGGVVREAGVAGIPGGHAIIDYKTGDTRVSAWLGERPEEPQLPMYAMGTAEQVDAVVFARVKAGDFKFNGLARRDGWRHAGTLIDAAGQHGVDEPRNRW